MAIQYAEFDIVASLENVEPYTINGYAFDIIASIDPSYLIPEQMNYFEFVIFDEDPIPVNTKS